MPEIRYPVSRPHLTAADADAVRSCVDRGQLSQGRAVEQFERDFARWLEVDHCVAVSSGTAALHLALAAAGVGPGDEVIVPDLTFVATANAVAYCGARVVLCDVDPATWTIDPEQVEDRITPRTKAVVPVHLYGVPADIARLTDVLLRDVRTHQPIAVIEDAAQALGAGGSPRAAGTVGLCGTFSFYGNKLITAGEGGAVVTDNAAVAGHLRLLRGQGMSPHQRYYHPVRGFNYRMTEMQGALLVSQLAGITDQLVERGRIRQWYDEALALRQLPVETQTSPHGSAVCWCYTVLLPEGADRSRVQQRLLEAGIDTRPAFVPLHDLPMYRQSGVAFPHASILGARGLSLPTYYGLTAGDVRVIVDALERAL